MRRLVWSAGLGLVIGCAGGPVDPLSQVSVRTDRYTYTDTSTVVVTVQNVGGGTVSLDGCPPPSVDIQDSVGTYSWVATAASVGFECHTDPSAIRLGPGDSVVVPIALPGLMPGTYRALASFGVNEGKPGAYVAGSTFEVR